MKGNLVVKDVRWTGLRRHLSLQNVVIAGIIAVMTVTFAVIVATLDRGFDWSDEGFVYAMIASNRISTGEVWGFHYLLGPLYELMGGSVLTFRILRLLGYVALGVVLTVLAHALLRPAGIQLGKAGWLLVGLAAQVGTFAAWSYPPRYLGYNELSSWLTQLGAALLILLLLEGRGTHNGRIQRYWWLWSITGLVVAALLLAKISAGLFLTLIAVIVMMLATNGGVWWKRCAALIGGLLAGFILMVASGVPLLSFISASAQFGTDPSAQAESGYSLVALLITYLMSMTTTFVTLAVPILLAGIILLVVRGLRTDTGLSLRLTASVENVTLFFTFALAVIVVALSVLPESSFFPADLDSWAALGVSNAFLLTLAVLAFAIVAGPALDMKTPTRTRGIATVALAFGLFTIAPLISALGTNNRIFGHTVFSATIWAVGAAVGLVLLWRQSTAISSTVRAIPVMLLGVIIASSGLAVAGDVFLHPYRTTPYFTQKAVVKVGDLKGIRLTQEEADLYTWLHDAGVRLDAGGVPALSIASPGALLAFNASAWSAIWPGPAWASSIAQSCDVDRPDDLFVLQAATEKDGTVGYDRLATGLATCGINFPNDFEIVDRYSSNDPARDVTVLRLE